MLSQTIGGKIIDSITGEPVPYAAIQYAKNNGVISNEEGDFQFRAEQADSTSITISCLGYETIRIPLAKMSAVNNIIALKEAAVQLNEVFLSNKIPNADEIIAKVRERISANYPGGLKSYHIFSRETGYMEFDDIDFEVTRATNVGRDGLEHSNKELDEMAKRIVEARSIHFRDFLGDLYRADEKTSKLLVQKATSLLDSKNDFSFDNIQQKAQQIVLQYLDTTKTYKLKTGIIKIEDSLKLDEELRGSDKPLEYDISSLRSGSQGLMNTAQFHEGSLLNSIIEPEAYTFNFIKATFLNDELVYILDFKPARGRSKYSGKMFVNGNDFGIIKLNYAFAEGKRGEKVNFKLLFGVKYVENVDRGTILFKRSENGTYTPSYIQRTRGNYFYIKRPLKFIENSTDRDKVTFNFILAGNSRDKEELLITSSAEIMDAKFQKITEAEKVPVIELSKYDETIWQAEETLQPLEEMRQFNAIQ